MKLLRLLDCKLPLKRFGIFWFVAAVVMFAVPLAAKTAQGDLPDNAESVPFLSPDLEVRINTAHISRAINKLSGTEYRTEFLSGSRICSSPDLTATLYSAGLHVNSNLNLKTVSTEIDLDSGLKLGVDVDGCSQAAARIDCSAQSGPFTHKDKIEWSGNCNYVVVILGVPYIGVGNFSFGDAIGPLVDVAGSYTVSVAEENGFSPQFGAFNDLGIWVPNASPTMKEVSLLTRSYGAHPPEFKVIGQSVVQANRTEALVVSTSVGSPFFNSASSPEEAAGQYMDIPEFDSNGSFAQLVLNPTFFAKTSSNGVKSGLLNELLPLRVTGKVSGQVVDVALDDPEVEFGEFEGEQAIRVQLAVRSINDGAYIEGATAYMVFDLPHFSGTELFTSLKSARIQIDTQDFDIDACLDWFITDVIDIELLSLAKLPEKIDIGLPDCLEIGDDRFVADRACAGGRKGRASRHANKDNFRIEIDPARSTTSLTERGSLLIDVPARLVIAN